MMYTQEQTFEVRIIIRNPSDIRNLSSIGSNEGFYEFEERGTDWADYLENGYRLNPRCTKRQKVARATLVRLLREHGVEPYANRPAPEYSAKAYSQEIDWLKSLCRVYGIRLKKEETEYVG